MIERLENWGNHYRDRKVIGTCGSLEKKFRSNWRQWLQLHEIEISISPDWRDAEVVEMAWRGLAHRHKMIIKWLYVTRRDPRSICVRLHIGRSRYEREFAAAHSAIKKLLEALDSENIMAYKTTSYC